MSRHTHTHEPWDELPAVTRSAPLDLRLDRAMRFVRGATVQGVRLSARAWARHPVHEWTGPPLEHERALIIVGGFAGSPDFYSLLRRSYEAAGYRRVTVMPPVDFSFADIRVSAQRLGTLVQLMGSDVDLVCHSEGGLMARWLVKQLDSAVHVRHVVTLGTPNRGLPVRIEDYPWLERFSTAQRVHQLFDSVARRTVLPMSSMALRQMLRGSAFMHELGVDVPPGRTEYLAIRSRWDGVIPFSSADLPDAPNVANVSLRGGPRVSHHGALASVSREAFEVTMTMIRRA